MEQETRTARDAGAPVKIGAEAVRAAAEGAAALSRGQAKSGQAHHRQRAVLEAAALGADGEGGRGRQSGGRAADQRLAGELHPQQARGRHGLLSGADGAAPEPESRQEAETLSRILPVLLKNDRFRRTYSKAWWDKLKSGCAVYGVFWDNESCTGWAT